MGSDGNILSERIESAVSSGGTFSYNDTALLFVESLHSEKRFLFFDAKYERTDPPPDAKSILLISLSNIGDVIAASAVFNGLREKYPDARIVFLTERPSGSLYAGNPDIDRVIEYSPKEIGGGFHEDQSLESLDAACGRFIDFLCELRAENFDTVLNLHASARSALIAGAAVADPSRRIGYSVGSDGTAVVRGNIWMHAYVGARIPAVRAPEETHIRTLGLAPSVRKTGVRLNQITPPAETGAGTRTIGVNLFASVREREWGEEKFSRLCRMLRDEMGCGVMIFAGPSARERKGAERVCDSLGGGVERCVGVPLDEQARAAGRCDLFITNDTGPMHVAGAVSTRCLAIHGPTNMLPYSSIGHIGISAAIPCAGCGTFTRCEDRKCFKLIEPEQVARGAEVMLERGPRGALEEFAGMLDDGKFPHGMITGGVYESITPRYLLRLRSAMPAESSIASELTRIGIFNVMRMIEAGGLDSGRRTAAADHPGLAAPFSPETALREVLKRHEFFKCDIATAKNALEEIHALRGTAADKLKPVEIVVLMPLLAFRLFAVKSGLLDLLPRAESVFGNFLGDTIKAIGNL